MVTSGRIVHKICLCHLLRAGEQLERWSKFARRAVLRLLRETKLGKILAILMWHEYSHASNTPHKSLLLLRVCINGLAIVWGETFTFKLLVSLIIQIFIIIMVLQREYVWMAWGRTSIFKMLDAFIVLVIFIIVIVLRREYVWMSWLLSAACKTCFKSPQRSPSTSVVTVATWWSSSWL